MLPAGKGNGQIWQDSQFICAVEYDISEAIGVAGCESVQRMTLDFAEEDCAPLLDAYDLTLILSDGIGYPIPRPLQQVDTKQLQCYIGSLP